jgi:hypothetical protein
MRHLELTLTYRCDLPCPNCSNLCTQAPVDHDELTLAQVGEFLDQSAACSYPWEWIVVQGGEPALHPAFLATCVIISEYRKRHNPAVELFCTSNGRHPLLLDEAERLGFRKEVNAKKHGHWRAYIPVNESPTDLGREWTLGCFQTSRCGICLNGRGWWPCSPMGAAARVFGYAPNRLRVRDLTEEFMVHQMRRHCHECGFAMPERRRVKEQTSSLTWRHVLGAYNETRK